MRKVGFFRNLIPILLYAIVGTLISTCAAAALFYLLSRSGVIEQMDGATCLLFATLISPTDPVATLAILRQVRARAR